MLQNITIIEPKINQAKEVVNKPLAYLTAKKWTTKILRYRDLKRGIVFTFQNHLFEHLR
jgi:hypothetical protein